MKLGIYDKNNDWNEKWQGNAIKLQQNTQTTYSIYNMQQHGLYSSVTILKQQCILVFRKAISLVFYKLLRTIIQFWRTYAIILNFVLL